MGDRDRIGWKPQYQARAPNGDLVEARTQGDLVEAVDEHAATNGYHEASYQVQRRGTLTSETSTGSE
jgi:hypothetical protein